MERKKRKAFINMNDCVACGCCIKVCPRNAIDIWKGIMAKVDMAKCIGCRKCAKECPASVIEIQEVTSWKNIGTTIFYLSDIRIFQYSFCLAWTAMFLYSLDYFYCKRNKRLLQSLLWQRAALWALRWTLRTFT